jgi:hypothetical protein
MSLRLPVLLLAAAVAVCLAAPTGAGAAYGRYVSFGDSSSTGSGLGTQKPDSLQYCYQTDYGYPTIVANALGVADFVPRNCSGAWMNDLTTTQDYPTEGIPYAPPQFDSLNGNEQIASLSMGDNDEDGFANVQTCFQDPPGNPAATPCRNAFVHGGVNQLVENTKTMGYDLGLAIDRFYELAPDATLFIVGYPRLTPPDGADCWGRTNISPGDAPVVDAWQQAVAAQQQAAAAAHGAVYVDMYEYSAGHDGCQPDAADRWSNPDILTGPTGWSNHPTLAGEQAMAARMVSMINTPRPPRPTSPPKPGVEQQNLSIRLGSTRLRPVAAKLKPFTLVRPRARGARLRVTLARAGVVEFVLERAKAGRVRNGKCRSMNRRAGRGRKACTLYVRATRPVGISLPAGTSTVYVTGRVAAKRLRPGKYRVRGLTGGHVARSKRISLVR